MKVLLAAPSYLPARRANTVQVMKMAQALVQVGQQVHLVVPDRTIHSRVDLDVDKESHRAPIDWPELAHQYGIADWFPVSWLPIRSFLRGYDYAYHILTLFQKVGADILYTRVPQVASFASLLGIPTIFEVHDMPQRAGKLLVSGVFAGQGLKRVVSITQSLLDDLNKVFNIPRKAGFSLVLADGVDIERFDAVSSAENVRLALISDGVLPERTYQLYAGYTGHLYAGRGIDLIIALAAQLPGTFFLIVGGNPDDVAKWKAAADKATLENIRFVGYVPNTDLPKYQAGCDVLLLPYQNQVSASSGADISRYMSPMKLFEYMASGKAIIASDLPVLREVLNVRNSVLLPMDDIGRWVSALQLMADDVGRRSELGTRAYHDVRQFTWKARAEKMLSGLEGGR